MRSASLRRATIVLAAGILPWIPARSQVATPLVRHATVCDAMRHDGLPRVGTARFAATRHASVPALRAIPASARAPDSAPPSPYNGLRLRSIGPALTSGRIGDIAVHPRDKQTWYVGVASGGVWKTTNAGTTWTPIFDNEASYSIGTVVIDPKNPNVVWVGTGENNAQRSVSYGDGVYKSVDGGRSWKNVGLKQSEHIGKILIDPRNSDVVYVASQGPLFNRGGDRGSVQDDGRRQDAGRRCSTAASGPARPTSCSIRAIRTSSSRRTWQRFRRQWGYIAGGPQSGVWRSTDGGATWKKSQTGLPTEDLGRVGLAVAPANPDVVYAIAEAANRARRVLPLARRRRELGAHERRTRRAGLYYNEIFPDPVNVDRVYSVDVQTMITEDAGRTFRRLGERNKHVDNHVVWIDPGRHRAPAHRQRRRAVRVVRPRAERTSSSATCRSRSSTASTRTTRCRSTACTAARRTTSR